jgi:hypothetical protein
MVQKAMLRSPEWRALSNSERVVWIYLKADFRGHNADKLRLSYASLKGIMAPATISKAFKGLEAKSWIEKTTYGGLHRHYCTYRLTGPFSNLPG